MAAHAEAMSEEAARRRVWAALVVGALFALPLFDTGRADGVVGSAVDGGEGGGVTGGATGGGRRRSSDSVRQLVMHVSVGLFVCGYAPFICQYVSSRDRMQRMPV